MDATNATDDELIALARRDPDAFAVLYRRHAPAVLAYLARRTGSAEVAADLTAEVFAAAYAARRRFRPRAEPFRAWVFAIANNKLVDSRRRQRVERAARRHIGMRPLEFAAEELERVESLVDAGRAAGQIAALLDGLPPSQRAAVLGRVVDERDYADLAADFRTTEANMRQRVRRGLARLEHAMGRRYS